ncbi:YceI family protein [Fulvivirga sp. 29W222]|uniref:YceI family protein n=1 Tax=Fulvivirga marina TaxID=2494733 RepID=A0A937FUC5_9BACT|nr:YceI family protein [Fulvivirga marina]MBL6446034.1 YceI family protein [Fulvivirga marina]
MKVFNKYLYFMIPILVISIGVKGQTNYNLSSVKKLEVAGTSTLHDWTMPTETAEGTASIDIDDNTLKSVSSLTVTMKGETLKSGKSGMDDNAYKALKTKKHPEITFKLKQVKSITKKSTYYLVDAVGTFTIAGESRTVNVQTKAYPTATTVTFTGSKDLKLTDFNIDPPTALLGTVKTGNEITINFNLIFKN